MSIGYYDRQGNPTSAAYWPSADERRVDRTELPDGVWVSTVHLVLDHRHGDDGPPLIFETMVFEGEHDQDCWRYSTEEEARAGHNAVVAWLKGEGQEPEYVG